MQGPGAGNRMFDPIEQGPGAGAEADLREKAVNDALNES